MLGRPERPPKLTRVLLVDDNDRYAAAITGDLESRGAQVVRVKSAREGVRLLEAEGETFDGLITDITMETQVSGLRVLSTARRLHFKGVTATASTGLDTGVGYLLNRFLLGTLYGCGYLIPKRLIKRRKQIAWIRIGRRSERRADVL